MEKVTVYTFNLKATVGFETEEGTEVSITEDEAIKLRDMLIKELVQTGK